MSSDFPTESADLCVKCGMCAPHCPTYALDQSEPESPRGRIAIMNAVAQGAVTATATAQTHIDHCLGCQACESVCPAKVPYLQLLDSHRQQQGMHSATPDRFIRSLVTLDLLRPLLRAGLKVTALIRPALMPFSRLLRRSSLYRLLSLAPDNSAWRQPARVPRPDIQLFVGCLGDLANAGTLKAFLKLCKALDIRVDAIPAQHCCGALAQHRGDKSAADKAKSMSSRKLRDDLPVIGLDSACVQQLRSSGWPGALDLCGFLATQDLSKLKLNQVQAQVLVHQPCSHRNGLAEPDAARHLLSKALPTLKLKDASSPQCCGAAGLHMLDFPERADALLEPKLNDCVDVDCVVSTNVGCALHIAGGLRRKHDKSRPKVYHPVELIAQALT